MTHLKLQKSQNGDAPPAHRLNVPIGTTLGWSRPSNTSAAKPFPWYLVVTANRTVNALVLWGVQIKKHPQFS